MYNAKKIFQHRRKSNSSRLIFFKKLCCHADKKPRNATKLNLNSYKSQMPIHVIVAKALIFTTTQSALFFDFSPSPASGRRSSFGALLSTVLACRDRLGSYIERASHTGKYPVGIRHTSLKILENRIKIPNLDWLGVR